MKILALFELNKIRALENKSGNVIDIFTKTSASLKEINMKIVEEQEKREVKISKLSSEIQALNVIGERNDNLINKLNTFLS